MTVSIRKRRWWFSVRASLVAACSVVFSVGSLPGFAQAQSAGEMKPVAIVALSGYDALIEDINFAGSLSGQPDLGLLIEPMIMGYTQGLDKANPIGIVIQSDGAEFGGALCVPVTNLETLLRPLQLFGLKIEEMEEGLTKLITPQQPQPMFVREQAGWAFVSPMQPMLDNLPDDPAKLLSAISEQYDLGARVNVQNIPETYRQMAVTQLEMGLQAGLQKKPEESLEQFETRQEMTKLQFEQIKQLINDIDEVTIGLAVDGSEQRAYFDFVYTAVPETKLAEKIAMNNDAKTDFAGFFQPDAAMMMSFASKMSEADIAQVDQMFGAIRKQLKSAVEKESGESSQENREMVQLALDDFLDAVQATLQAGVMDGGAVLNLAPHATTFVAGGFIGEPAKVESGLKKLAEAAKEEEKFPGVRWNAENHGNISFHTVSLPIPEHEEEPRKMFGETMDLAVGIGKQSVYFALGRNCLDAAKSVIDASLAEPQKSIPPVEMTVSLKQIMKMAAEFADSSDKPTLESIAGMLNNEATGRDHVRIVAQAIPNGIRTRVEAEEGVLRAIGMAAMKAQMEAAAAAQAQ